MNKFPLLQQSEQRVYFEQAGATMGLYAPYVEKDFWVCWVLNRLYSQPNLSDHITFKGGTSLSKVWGVIQRFSEDIDLTINRDFLGFGGEDSPEKATSNNKKKDGLKRLRQACHEYVIKDLYEILNEDFKKNLPEGLVWTLKIDGDDPDGQTLLFEYPSSWSNLSTNYVRPIVKLEFGARSDPWPASQEIVRAFVATIYPKAFTQIEVNVLALAAERTFWEKTMLIHEETFRPVDKPRGPRMARHYYDLWCLINKGVAKNAIADKTLFDSVAEHRKLFFNQNWVDYATLKRGSLRLLPDKEHMSGWRKDYEEMSQMFLGQPPTFDEVLDEIAILEKTLNNV